MSNLEFVGKLSIPKETEKFHPYEDKTFPSGWRNKTSKINITCRDNRHLIQIKAGAWADGHGDIYSFTKGGVDDDGNKIKGTSLKIPFKDRLNAKWLDQVAEFKKCVVDLEEPGRRYTLKQMAEKIKEGTSITDDELKSVGLVDESEVNDALKESNEKHHAFVSEWDFLDFVKEVLENPKYKNRKFKVVGQGDYSYSDVKQQVYTNYVPTRLYLASDDAEEYSKATLNFNFGEESLDSNSEDELGKSFVNGWIFEYDSNRKGNIPVPITITLPCDCDEDPEKAKKKYAALKRKFTVDDGNYYRLNIVVDMLDGAQRAEVSLDDLPDEVVDDIEAGLITMEEVARDMGGSVYGERVREYRFNSLGRGASKGREATAYTAENFEIKPIEDNADDLFDDDDL